ncbi:MAG: hypothetical protein KatS3mg057_3189 [Herpetosiphonaceae bacterium]|nr:MAG: hypothetical protein KatS3mg057_3189 [Herpetosiphonaceae bacterium]
MDHNGDVAGPTPRRAADSNFWVATSLPAPMAPLAPHQMRQFGAYDLPQGQGWQTRVGLAAGAAPAVDTRTGLASTMLDPVNWQQRTNRHRFARPPAVSDIGMNNAQLVILDGLIPQYDVEKTNWEAVRAAAVLNQIIAAATAWLAANNNPPSNWHPFKKARYNRGRAKIQTLLNEANAHHAFWTNPANQNPPAGLERQYRRPTPANPNPAWRNRHPIAGAGNEEYASILEIVTRPYEPETVAGRAGLIAAMTEADQLAQAIENQTGNFANRIAFNTIPNANILNPLTHVGNAGPTRNPQRTDASIQSTFAVDLTQLPSLMRSTVAFGAPQQLFGLKHQGDVMASMTNPHTIHRAEQEMSRGAVNATRVINDVKAQIGGGAPSFVNLRGLVTLICQYLQLGKYWDPGGVQVLDKNLTDLLSRTDLSQIYQNAVPPIEKNWLQANPAHLNFLIGRIFHYTQRTPASVLLNNPNENRAPGGAPQFAITCQQFVNNIFTQGSDGITPHFGGFQQRPVEDIDPTGTQRPGEGIGGAAHRMAPVFELRNMMPKMVGDRFPRTDWVNLASYMAEMINLLNARTQAQATQDVRIDEQQQLGGPTTAAVGATLPAW